MSQFSSSTGVADGYLRVMRGGAMVRDRNDLLKWLGGDLQEVLPHAVLLAAWGNFADGSLAYHLLSSAKEIDDAAAADVMPFLLNKLHLGWTAEGRMPFRANFGSITALLSANRHASLILGGLSRMRSAVVHGLRDKRSGQDCMYVLLSEKAVAPVEAESAFGILLPCIDNASRQLTASSSLASLSRSSFPAAQSPDVGELSEREAQVMGWVAAGKTNSEIGSILGISAFTVKNHMQRIFRKLDVFNRAQAVSKVTQVSLYA